MDGNSSPRGRHRHRATPGNRASADGSPQWSPSVPRPQWTPTAGPPRWTAAPATAPRRTPEPAAERPPAGKWSSEPAGRRTADDSAQSVPEPGREWGAAPGREWGAAPGRQPAPERGWQWLAEPADRQVPEPPRPWIRAPGRERAPGAGRQPAPGPDERSVSGRPPQWAPDPGRQPAPAPGQEWVAAADRSSSREWAAGPDRPSSREWVAAADGPSSPQWVAGPDPQPIPQPAGQPLPELAAAPARRGVRHPVRLALYALVLFGLLAGSAAWLAVDKSVRLSVDGEARTISTYASTVAGVLDDAGLTVSDRDLLAPAAETRISDGAEIVLRRGRLLRLTIDGKTREVWVTATTVQEALDQIGYRQSGLFVSATRSQRLPLDGYDLTVRTPKTVTVLADGRRQRVVTTAATVGEALDQLGVTVDGDDKVSQLASAAVVDGMTVTVTRVARKTTTVRTVLEYDTVEKQDADAPVGSREVTTNGVDGLQQVTY